MQMIMYAIPFFLVTMFLEYKLLERDEEKGRPVIGYEPKDTAASISMGLGMLGVNVGAKVAALAFFVFLYQYRVFDIPWTWWGFVLLFFAEDFCYYWFHRVSHEVRFFWAAHINHHSSQHYNLSTALRQSWTTPLTGPIFWAPLALLGFDVKMILIAQTWSLLYQYWIHTERIGKDGFWRVFGWVFNTPSHHRVHHGSNPRYLDRNHAGILIIWDRMFGTFEPEVDHDPVDYGLTKNIDTFNPVKIAFHEWVAMFRDAWNAKTLRGKLGTFIMPPGWNEVDGGTTSKVLRARAGIDAPNDGVVGAPATVG